MPTYRRIEVATDLIAGEKEGDTLDFKGYQDAANWGEIAKDVAAFANHLGGVLLVGATEQPDGTATYGGLPDDKATPIATAYEKFALQKCVPRQAVHPKKFRLDSGNFMIAVNVEPSPVFVASEWPTKGEVESGSTAWRFPMRCGRDTDYLSPELLPMFLSPEKRRSSVLLGRLEGQTITLITRHPGNHVKPEPQETFAVVKGADLRLNTLHLEVREPGPIGSWNAYLPFEDVEAVWMTKAVLHGSERKGLFVGGRTC